jgi:hypothetical protein
MADPDAARHLWNDGSWRFRQARVVKNLVGEQRKRKKRSDTNGAQKQNSDEHG